MSAVGSIFAVLLASALVALVVGFIYALWQAPVSVVAPVLGALIALGGGLAVKQYERQNAIKQERRVQQAAIYESFVAKITGLTLDSAEKPQEEDLVKFVRDFTPRLIVHGSPEFIRAWNAFRYASHTNDFNALTSMGALLTAIRKDLGHGGTDVSSFELLQTFINDLDKEFPQRSLPSTPEDESSV